MALDFCIRDNHDQVIIQIPIGLDSFNEITEKSKQLTPTSLISERLVDYFDDAEFYIDELPRLKSDFENLVSELTDEHSSQVLYLLIKLCDIASALRKTITVIAD